MDIESEERYRKMEKKKRGPKHPMPREFYQEIGRKGGLAASKNPYKGFGCLARDKNGLTGPERAKIAGAKGGRIGGKIGKRGEAKK